MSSYYIGHARAVLAWVALQDGELDRCVEQAQRAIESWGPGRDDLGVNCEFAWFAAWPLVAVAVNREDTRSAVAAMQMLLSPWERPLPDELAERVRRSVQTGALTDIEGALELARLYTLI